MVNGTFSQSLPVSGAYDIAANGRGGLTMAAGGTNHAAFYLLSSNTACTVGVDSWGPGVSRIVPQAGGKPFSAASLNGRYAFALRGTLSSEGTDITGQILLNGLGALAGAVDVNASGVLSENVPVTGSYTMGSTGRGTATISSATSTWTVTMYLADPGAISLIGTSYPSNGYLVRQF
jgi:hypothetical protein